MTIALTISEKAELEKHEQTIEKGLKTFYQVGIALATIRDKRLYRAAYPTFEDYCHKKWGMSKTHANRLVASSDVIENLAPMGVISGDVEKWDPMGSQLPTSERQTRPLTKLEPEQQREAWEHVVQEAQETGARITGKKVQATVDRIMQDNAEVAELDFEDDRGCSNCKWKQDAHQGYFCDYLGMLVDGAGSIAFRCITNGYWEEEIVKPEKKPHVTQNTGNNEWYTPSEYTDAARQAMGGIDCDPASSEIANRTIRATTYYTIETDGLSNPWSGRVWMNPPYSQPLIAQFCDALAEKYKSDEISEACVLVNNASETAWFDVLAECAICRCDVGKRIRFIDKDGNPGGGPLQGQVILYFGPNDTKFAEVFEQFGRIWHAW